MFRDGAERLLVFRVGTERFAVRLGAVDEVMDAPPVHALPDSAQQMLGVATIQGSLVPIYDPRSLLGVAGDTYGTLLLFGARGGKRIGMAIDDVYDAITVEESDLRSAPGTDASDGVLIGVIQRAGHLVAVLDADPVLDALMSVSDGDRK